MYVEAPDRVFKEFLTPNIDDDPAMKRAGVDDNGEGDIVRLQPILRFGSFQFDPEALLLTRGYRSLELSPKALQVLAVLIRNAGRVVSKDDLLNIVGRTP